MGGFLDNIFPLPGFAVNGGYLLLYGVKPKAVYNLDRGVGSPTPLESS
jgi:hypothetical protein